VWLKGKVFILLQNEVNSKDLNIFLREILNSIRELNRRIDELKIVIKSGWCDEKGKKKLIDRIVALMDTRFNLIYSVQDMRCKLINSFPPGSIERWEMNRILNVENLYKDLRSL
jgi:hypothetical protein